MALLPVLVRLVGIGDNIPGRLLLDSYRRGFYTPTFRQPALGLLPISYISQVLPLIDHLTGGGLH